MPQLLISLEWTNHFVDPPSPLSIGQYRVALAAFVHTNVGELPLRPGFVVFD
jgi:hypothetical protein